MRILQHVTRVLTGKGNHPPLSMGLVSDRNVELVRQHTRFDISQHERVLESSDIRHTIASHGDAIKEAVRGQKAISKHDFGLIPEIVENAHAVHLRGAPKAARTQRQEYHATIAGNHYIYVEEIRPRARAVALETMRKS